MLSKFLFRNLKGYRFLIVIAILMAIAQVGSDILSALSLKFIVSKVGNPGNDPACQFPFLNGPLSLFDSPLFDRSLQGAPGQPPKMPPVSPCPISISRATTQHSVIGVIIFSLIMLIVFGALSAIMIYVERLLASSIGQNLTARLRRQLFEHLQRLSLDWHGKQKKGDLVQRVIGNIADIEKLVTDGVVDLLAGTLTLVGVAIIMSIISPQYTLLSLAIAPALFMIALTYTKSIKAAAKKAAKAEGQVANVATEDIGALTVIKVFTREDREAMRFAKYVGNKREAGLRASGLQAQFTPIVAILVALGTAIVVGVGGYVAAGHTFKVGFFTIPAGAIDIGVLVVFLTYLKMLYQPMKDLSKLFPLASSAGSGAERIQEVLDQAPEVIEPTGPYYGPQKFKGEIQFENVVFGYTLERPILKGINLHIPAGQKIALVGLSGGGKTTLVKLIPRFYEIQQGSVKLDGADNRLYPLSVLRQNVSMVLQDSVLFEGTIRENIEIGRPGASMEEIVEAAKQAHIHDTIMGMADKYDTMVREQGKNFSGGQRQRLAIARAILRDAPILILDEPTASLDVEAEAEVMRALDQLVVNRTVLMISHRLSTLGNVDEIIVLKDGRIVEQGTFKELKRRNGVFAGLLDEQNRYNIEREGEKSILRSAFVPRPGSYDQVQVPSPQRPSVVPPTPAVSRSPQPGPYPMPVAPAPAQWNKVDVQQVQPVKGNGPQPAVSPQNARVVIEVDGKVVGERELNKPVLTVGRLSGNDVQVPSQRVSRLHAKIRWENGTWLIEDAESLNGLVYQGHRVDRLVLSNGDRIHVAPTAVIQYKTTP